MYSWWETPLCSKFLNEIVEESGITEPGLILSELRHMVIKSLKQSLCVKIMA